MKKGMAILGSILLIIGLGMGWAGRALGGQDQATVRLFGRSWEVRAAGIGMDWGVRNTAVDGPSSTLMSGQTEEAEGFTFLTIDLDVGDVVVTAGDSFGVERSFWGDGYEIDYNVYDGGLSVYSIGSGGFNCGGSVRVTVPAGAFLEVLYADVDVGNVSLYGLTLQELQLDLDVGDALGEGLTVYGTVDVDADVGNVTLYGDLGEQVNVDADVGNVTLGLSRPAEDYWWDLMAGMGVITVDGRQASSGGFSSAVNGGYGNSGYIYVDADLGNIDLSFGLMTEQTATVYTFTAQPRPITDYGITAIEGEDGILFGTVPTVPSVPAAPSAPAAPTPPTEAATP